MPTQFDLGFLVGLLVGEGHFGGDGRQPQVTLRMHVRHEAIFRWLERTFPGGRVYGPYHHDGRAYLQWMARGLFLRERIAPLLDRYLSPDLDRHSFERFQLMKARYPDLRAEPRVGDDPVASPVVRRPRMPRSAAAAEAGITSMSVEAADRPVGRRPARGRRGGGRRTTSPPASGRSAASVDSVDAFADLFARLRQAWPAERSD